MGFHMDNREAAEAHLRFQGFVAHSRKGQWRNGKCRARILEIEGSDVVLISVWAVR